MTLVEGPNAVAEAAAAGATIIEVFGLVDDLAAQSVAEESGAVWVPVVAPLLERLAGTETPRGPVAVIETPAPDEHSTRDVVWLDISDPGNAGTVIRTASAFEFDVVFAPGSVDPWSPKVVRSGAGGHFRTNVDTGDVPAAQILATVPSGGVSLYELGSELRDDRLALLIGNEAHGLAGDLVADADIRVTIPMPSRIESLNAAVAAAIVMYEIRRFRSQKTGT